MNFARNFQNSHPPPRPPPQQYAAPPPSPPPKNCDELLEIIELNDCVEGGNDLLQLPDTIDPGDLDKTRSYKALTCVANIFDGNHDLQLTQGEQNPIFDNVNVFIQSDRDQRNSYLQKLKYLFDKYHVAITKSQVSIKKEMKLMIEAETGSMGLNGRVPMINEFEEYHQSLDPMLEELKTRTGIGNVCVETYRGTSGQVAANQDNDLTKTHRSQLSNQFDLNFNGFGGTTHEISKIIGKSTLVTKSPLPIDYRLFDNFYPNSFSIFLYSDELQLLSSRQSIEAMIELIITKLGREQITFASGLITESLVTFLGMVLSKMRPGVLYLLTMFCNQSEISFSLQYGEVTANQASVQALGYRKRDGSNRGQLKMIFDDAISEKLKSCHIMNAKTNGDGMAIFLRIIQHRQGIDFLPVLSNDIFCMLRSCLVLGMGIRQCPNSENDKRIVEIIRTVNYRKNKTSRDYEDCFRNICNNLEIIEALKSNDFAGFLVEKFEKTMKDLTANSTDILEQYGYFVNKCGEAFYNDVVQILNKFIYNKIFNSYEIFGKKILPLMKNTKSSDPLIDNFYRLLTLLNKNIIIGSLSREDKSLLCKLINEFCYINYEKMFDVNNLEIKDFIQRLIDFCNKIKKILPFVLPERVRRGEYYKTIKTQTFQYLDTLSILSKLADESGFSKDENKFLIVKFFSNIDKQGKKKMLSVLMWEIKDLLSNDSAPREKNPRNREYEIFNAFQACFEEIKQKYVDASDFDSIFLEIDDFFKEFYQDLIDCFNSSGFFTISEESSKYKLKQDIRRLLFFYKIILLSMGSNFTSSPAPTIASEETGDSYSGSIASATTFDSRGHWGQVPPRHRVYRQVVNYPQTIVPQAIAQATQQPTLPEETQAEKNVLLTREAILADLFADDSDADSGTNFDFSQAPSSSSASSSSNPKHLYDILIDFIRSASNIEPEINGNLEEIKPLLNSPNISTALQSAFEISSIFHSIATNHRYSFDQSLQASQVVSAAYNFAESLLHGNQDEILRWQLSRIDELSTQAQEAAENKSRGGYKLKLKTRKTNKRKTRKTRKTNKRKTRKTRKTNKRKTRKTNKRKTRKTNKKRKYNYKNSKTIKNKEKRKDE